MGHKNRVAPARRETPVRLIRELEFGQNFAAFEAGILAAKAFTSTTPSLPSFAITSLL